MEIIIIWLGMAIACSMIAASKGRSGLGWLILGGLFSLIALIIIIALPAIRPDQIAPSPSTHVRCPDCREFVLKEARVCKHCGCKLVPQ